MQAAAPDAVHANVAAAASRWDRVFLYARLPNVERYRRWGFEVVPGNLPRTHRLGQGAAADRIVQMMRWRESM